MNALELADKLDKSQAWMDALHTQYKNGFGKYCALPKEVATMLRQQQEQIEVLKAVLKEVINGMGHSHQAKFKEYLK